MSVRKEAWKNPEEATPEELLEMVLSQRAWLKAAKKKAAKANTRLEDITQLIWYASHAANGALMQMNMYEQTTGKLEGWLRRAKLSTAVAAKRLAEVQAKLWG